MRFGYACINLTLAEQKIKVNRSMIRQTFRDKGIEYASALALANITDLEKVIDWNIEHGLTLYRMSSEMIPWMSEYEIADLPDFEKIRNILARCGEKAANGALRLTFHPGPFNVLASSSELVLSKTKKELRQHAEFMDLLHLPESPFAKINIHVGGAYGNKALALSRFAENYMSLPPHIKKRLTVENDDKMNMFSVTDLIGLHNETQIPVVFDFFHHEFCTGGLSEEEALLAAVDTWPDNIKPVVHFSSSRKKFEDASVPATAHADYIYKKLNDYNTDVDVMFEAKAKDVAVMKYVKDHKIKLLY